MGRILGENQRVLCKPLPGCLLPTAWRSLRAGLGPSKVTRLANYFAQITVRFSGPRVSQSKVWRKDGRRLTNLSTCSFLLFGLPTLIWKLMGATYRIAVLYQWLGPSRPSRYVGVASLQRASRPGMPGPALRWWEHLLHWSRRSLKGSQLKKHVLFRKASGSNMGFLISRAGPSTLMYAAATFLPFRASASSFFWDFLFSDLLSSTLLFSLTLPISAFHLSILSEVWLLNFLRWRIS